MRFARHVSGPWVLAEGILLEMFVAFSPRCGEFGLVLRSEGTLELCKPPPGPLGQFCGDYLAGVEGVSRRSPNRVPVWFLGFICLLLQEITPGGLQHSWPQDWPDCPSQYITPNSKNAGAIPRDGKGFLTCPGAGPEHAGNGCDRYSVMLQAPCCVAQ